ncbi:MAG TPA: hypothetical protein VGC34_08595 [Steroidobacteraceae bacterium]
MTGLIARLQIPSFPMSTARSEPRREIIRKKLVQSAGSVPDAKAIATVTVAIWLQVYARLTPVIGTRGVDVLFKRTLHVTRISLPWLAVSEGEHRGATSLDDIRAHLERQAAPVAAAASCEMLFAFTVLLATLIGDSLTDRLLGPVWAPALPASERESGL